MPSPSVKRILLGSSFDPDALSYFQAIDANGGSIGGPAKQTVNQFIRGLKSDGLWDRIADMGLFAGVDNFNAAMVKLKTPAGTSRILTNTNFVSADYTPTGATAGLSAISGARNLRSAATGSAMGMTNASFHMGVYSTGNLILRPSSNVFMGFSEAANIAITAFSYTAPNFTGFGGDLASIVTAPGVDSGYVVESAITNSDLRFFVNGTQSGATQTTTRAAIASAVELELYTYNVAGVSVNATRSTARFTAYHAGLGLSAAQSLTLSNRMNSLMRAFGAAVY